MDSTVIVAAISASAAVVAAAMAYRASTRAAKVNETANTLRWAEELREDAADARREARDARQDAAAASRQIRELRSQLDDLVSWAQWVVRTIHRPGMDMERLRETIPREIPSMPPNRR